MGSTPETGLLRVKLSPRVDPDALRQLHGGSLEAAPLRALLAQAGALAVKPVYALSSDEIAEDKYGFAREFSLTIKPGMDPDAAAAALAASDLVEDVRPVLLRRSSDD